jgi:predicted dehydrogenase
LPAAAHELVFVMDKWRYHPAIEKLGELVMETALGQLRGITTRRLDSTLGQSDVDCTWILLPHELSIAREILGGTPVAVEARAEYESGKVIDMVSHLQVGAAAALSRISTRWLSRERTVEVAFADGMANFDLNDESTIILTRTGDGTSTKVEVPFRLPLRRELDAFAGHLAGQGPTPKSSFADGVETVRTIERLRELALVDKALTDSSLRLHAGARPGHADIAQNG